MKMINKPQRLKTYLIGELGDLRHRFIRFDRIFHVRQFHCPALRQRDAKFQRHT